LSANWNRSKLFSGGEPRFLPAQKHIRIRECFDPRMTALAKKQILQYLEELSTRKHFMP
jgi:hypothetical protein